MEKSANKKSGLGTFPTLTICIGGMVGGGIFAVTGLTIQVTQGGAPLAFLIAGIVALLTSYSYLRLTLRFPGEGGTVQFLNRAFGDGILTGAANILLLLSYVVLIANASAEIANPKKSQPMQLLTCTAWPIQLTVGKGVYSQWGGGYTFLKQQRRRNQ